VNGVDRTGALVNPLGQVSATAVSALPRPAIAAWFVHLGRFEQLLRLVTGKIRWRLRLALTRVLGLGLRVPVDVHIAVIGVVDRFTLEFRAVTQAALR
jgi:hypothetical protein